MVPVHPMVLSSLQQRMAVNTDGKVVSIEQQYFYCSQKNQSRFKMLNSVDRGKALWQASVNDKQDPAAGYGEIYKFDWNHDFDNPVLNGVTVQPFVGGDPNTPAGNTDWQECNV